MELNIAIVDDQQFDRDRIRNMLHRYFTADVSWKVTITEFDSAENFLRTYRKGAYHIVFVDIFMGEIGGIELSKRLRTGDENIEIIFMSSTTELMIDTFCVKPASYLYKPFTYEKFSEDMKRTLRSFKKEVRLFTIRLSKTEIAVPMGEIVSAVSDKHSTDIKLLSGMVYRCMSPYSKVSTELLSEQNFIECNRGIIINMDYVIMLKNTDSDVTMQDNTSYPIRYRDRRAIIGQITRYIATNLKGGINI